MDMIMNTAMLMAAEEVMTEGHAISAIRYLPERSCYACGSPLDVDHADPVAQSFDLRGKKLRYGIFHLCEHCALDLNVIPAELTPAPSSPDTTPHADLHRLPV